MIPLYDTQKPSRFPFVTYSIIALNIILFAYQIFFADPNAFILRYGFIPSDFSFFDVRTYAQVFTSMWLHGGFLHIIFNLWFLHIFGDNVEDRLGHLRFLGLYLFSGAVAVFAQYIVFVDSTVPLIGASGAIAGITGAYYVFFRHSRIMTLVPSLYGLFYRVKLPAWMFIGYWFILQIFSGAGSLSAVRFNQGGVAFFAHIGGFIFGYIISKACCRFGDSGGD